MVRKFALSVSCALLPFVTGAVKVLIPPISTSAATDRMVRIGLGADLSVFRSDVWLADQADPQGKTADLKCQQAETDQDQFPSRSST